MIFILAYNIEPQINILHFRKKGGPQPTNLQKIFTPRKAREMEELSELSQAESKAKGKKESK